MRRGELMEGMRALEKAQLALARALEYFRREGGCPFRLASLPLVSVSGRGRLVFVFVCQQPARAYGTWERAAAHTWRLPPRRSFIPSQGLEYEEDSFFLNHSIEE